MSAVPLSSWWLGVTAERDPDARALTVDGASLTYRELRDSALVVAAGLAHRGVGYGDRILWMGGASCRTVELLHAAQRLGAALCPLSTRAAADELAAQSQRLRPRLIVCDGEHRDRAAEIAATTGVEVVSDDDVVRGTHVSLPGGSVDCAIDSSAPLALLCTSGATGVPKAVVLSNAACHASALAAAQRLGYQAGQAWLAAMPLHHVGGLSILLRAAILGAEVVLRDGFDAERTRDDVVRFAICHASLVPTMLHRLLALESVPAASSALSRCCFLLGGAALSADLARRAESAGLDVRATYGMTEAASQVTTTQRGEGVTFPETVGRALDGIELRIDGSDDEGYGEIMVAGPTLFSGYFGDSIATRTALRSGVLRTGDLGRVDADGRLYVASRRVDLIVTGGENVRPEEVERVLESHPTIAEAGVYGVPDEEWGQRVAAIVVARDSAHIDAAELAQWCRERLAAFKIPRQIEVATSVPRTAGGKLMRSKLRDRR